MPLTCGFVGFRNTLPFSTVVDHEICHASDLHFSRNPQVRGVLRFSGAEQQGTAARSTLGPGDHKPDVARSARIRESPRIGGLDPLRGIDQGPKIIGSDTRLSLTPAPRKDHMSQ